MHNSFPRNGAVALLAACLVAVFTLSTVDVEQIGLGLWSDTTRVDSLAMEGERAAGSGLAIDTGWLGLQNVRTDPIIARNGMVVAGNPDASKVGLDILQRGGNAMDAAVATGFALAVTLPHAGNIGGGGFLAIRLPDGEVQTIDFREKAPQAAHRDLYLDEFGALIPGASSRGALASGVPGTVAGLLEAHARHGSLPLRDVLEPAVRLAEDGVRLTERQALLYNQYRERFQAYPSTARYFSKPGSARFAENERFRQTDLASTLRRIQREGRDGFYTGRTADLIVAEMNRSGGIITHADLAAYEPVWREPLVGQYRGHTVYTTPPPSAGGVTLIQLIGALEAYPLRTLGRHSPEAIHVVAEAMRRSFADRAVHLGDPDFWEVPLAGLVDERYLRGRMRQFDYQRATPSEGVRAGTPPILANESTETTHYSVVDSQGTAVAVTYTINDYFGSHLVVDGAGFFLNNEMDDFVSRPGEANLWGLVGSEANAIAPGKRMLSSMAPVIVADPRGRLFLVVGSPGGSTIPSTVFQVISNIIDFGMNVQEAVVAPRFHHQWFPDALRMERGGFAPETQDRLERIGHQVNRVNTFGAADAIHVRYSADGSLILHGGADPRRADDTALGY